MTPGAVVTIAALYGTGGATIGPRVAEGAELMNVMGRNRWTNSFKSPAHY
jgi:hypothetical protein